MRVELLTPDVSPVPPLQTPQFAGTFERLVDDLGSVLDRAANAENAFASGAGDLQTAVYNRARADIAISVATSAAQRAAQALQSVLNMQV